jgi:hypothetical protein
MTRSRSTTVLLRLALVILVAISSWLLGNRLAIAPASAQAATTQPVDGARDGILVAGTGEVSGCPTRYGQISKPRRAGTPPMKLSSLPTQP